MLVAEIDPLLEMEQCKERELNFKRQSKILILLIATFVKGRVRGHCEEQHLWKLTQVLGQPDSNYNRGVWLQSKDDLQMWVSRQLFIFNFTPVCLFDHVQLPTSSSYALICECELIKGSPCSNWTVQSLQSRGLWMKEHHDKLSYFTLLVVWQSVCFIFILFISLPDWGSSKEKRAYAFKSTTVT